MFRLAICLQMEGYTYSGFNTNEFKKVFFKLRCKAGVPIRDNVLGYTV